MGIPRNRDKNLASTFGTFHTENDVTGATTDTSLKLITAYSEEMSDVVTPNFRQLIAEGVIINNPCNYTKTTIGSSGSTSGKTQVGGTSNPVEYKIGSGYLTAAVVWPLDLESINPSIAWGNPQADMAKAKLQCLASIDRTPYAFGEDSYELRETIRFIRNPLKSLADIARSFSRARNRTFYTKKGRLKAQWESTKDLSLATANLWSSYSFAAAPLMRSVSDGIEAWHTLPSRIHLRPDRLSAHGRNEQEFSGDWSFPQDTGGGSYRTWVVHRDQLKDVHASCLYTVTNPCYDMRTELGLGSKAFPVTMWQILPLSFMIDRVYDVTSFLKAAINITEPKVLILSGSETVKSTRNQTQQYAAYYHPTNTSTLKGETVLDTFFEYDRQPWTPSFYDTLPSLNAKGIVEDATKIADLASVLLKMLNRTSPHLT